MGSLGCDEQHKQPCVRNASYTVYSLCTLSYNGLCISFYAACIMYHVFAFCAYVYLYLSLLPSPSIYVYMNVGLPAVPFMSNP